MGAMGDLGVHKSDLIRYLLGDEVAEVSAFISTLHKEGTAVDDNNYWGSGEKTRLRINRKPGSRFAASDDDFGGAAIGANVHRANAWLLPWPSQTTISIALRPA